MRPAVARTRNKGYYRVLHVPIWIWVFFTLPGALTADLYAHGPDSRHWIWLAIVTLGCAVAGSRGWLPGTEAKPYITHYGLDWPNLPYRVICYTAAWIDILVPWLLNLAGLIIARLTGHWEIRDLYGAPYVILALLVAGAAGANWLPRTRRTIYGEGAERGWFYIGVWTAVLSQAAALAMWRLGAHTHMTPAFLIRSRLAVFVMVSCMVLGLGLMAKLGRTQRYYAGRELGELRPAESE